MGYEKPNQKDNNYFVCSLVCSNIDKCCGKCTTLSWTEASLSAWTASDLYHGHWKCIGHPTGFCRGPMPHCQPGQHPFCDHGHWKCV
ncbi:hypothetical protein [Methanosarcina sp. UBA5]|uniref:hypothetical protein n=1 Tax=Methanosarcina sp. UBA5 TaxID=1915593 RepID=UPI0025FE2FE0|nr:hypothetical protein [Methanosarcina sp. UBA5]